MDSIQTAVETARKDKTVDIAKSMKQKAYSITEIAELTGLSKEELQSIHKPLKKKDIVSTIVS